jgi:xylulokinase
MVQSVLEGVAFAIRDSFEAARGVGLDIRESGICGGGSKSPVWREILANVLGIPLRMMKTEQGPGYGAAMLAMVSSGAFPDVKTAATSLTGIAQTISPDAELTALYNERYAKFRQIYPTLKPLFETLA